MKTKDIQQIDMKSEKANIMRISLAALVLAAAIAVPVIAQSITATSLNPRFKEIFFLGQGLAVNPANPLQDVKVVKTGIATVTVNVAGTDTDISIGVLYFDTDKYVLKDLSLGNGTASGNIYLNNTVVGNFALNLISKPSDNIWDGTITLNGQTFNAYILEARRAYTQSEESQSVGDFCHNNPQDASCTQNIQQFCQDNPNDQKCVSIIREFCRTHLSDLRCRIALGDFCSQHQTNNPTCQEFCKKYPNLCSTSTSSTNQTATTTTSNITTMTTTLTTLTNTTTASSSTTVTTTTTNATSSATTTTTSPTSTANNSTTTTTTTV